MLKSLFVDFLIISYIIIMFLTFGYGANRQCEYTGNLNWSEGCNLGDAAAAYFFIIWPIYWGARLSIEITK